MYVHFSYRYLVLVEMACHEEELRNICTLSRGWTNANTDLPVSVRHDDETSLLNITCKHTHILCFHSCVAQLSMMCPIDICNVFIPVEYCLLPVAVLLKLPTTVTSAKWTREFVETAVINTTVTNQLCLYAHH